MGASLVKSCFRGDCMYASADATPRPRRATQQQPLPHHHSHSHTQRHAHSQSQSSRHVPPAPALAPHHKPSHPAHALECYHVSAHAHTHHQRSSRCSRNSREIAMPQPPPRKLSPYEKHRFELEMQLRSPALPLKATPRRERWDSRESTCSSSSSMEDEMAMMARYDSSVSYEKEQMRRRSRRSSGNPRSLASTTLSEDSFSRYSASVSHSTRSSGSATPASSRRQSNASSPTFGFEDLLPECYVLEEMIGSGTTSKCYRTRRTTDGRFFACKIINKRRLAFDHHQREDMAQQLRQEVDVLRRLDHPNIAKLEDAFENDTYILLMMELLDGGELFDTIIDRVRLTEADAKHVAHSILDAINYMHSQGIVHRDIKPENLLLAASAVAGTPLLVKMVDFGFASSVHTHASMTSFLGTGGYLAPEVLLHRPYTAAVDTWGFGVLLYLMLCGRLPFPTAIQLQPGQRISSLYRLTFPDKYWRGVSSSSRDLLSKLLVLNPAHRITPADALKHPWFHTA